MERLRALAERIRADIRANPGLWVGVGISVVIAILAYLAYRQSANRQQSQVPANGYGFPNYSGAGTSDGGLGMLGGGYNPLAGAAPGAAVQPIAVPQIPAIPTTPTTPAMAIPDLPPFSIGQPVAPFAFAPRTLGPLTEYFVPARASRASSAPSVTPSAAPSVNGNIQNPSAAQTYQHRGTTPAQTIQPYFIPTTLQPSNSGHGRAA